MSYEFHGIKWMSDNELDADSPEKRGPGWAHAYVPVLGPEGTATGTAHIPIYMPRVYKELKRFALAVYKAAGGTVNNVEMSGWWSSIKKAFKKMAKVVANNKVLRQVAAKGLTAAIPGGSAVSEKAAGILEDLVSKYRGGSTEAANQIKGLLEKANKGSEQDAKVLDEVRREYVRQQAAGLPALMTTMASGEVIVYDPIYGAKRKMSKKQQKKTNTQRMKAAMDAKRKAAQARRTPSTSPLRNSAATMRQPLSAQPSLLQQQNMAQMQQQMADPYGYPQQGYPQNYGYPQQDYPEAYAPDYAPQGAPQYDEGQEAQDDEDLQAAAEENMARMSSVEDIDSEMEGDAYFDIGKKKLTSEQKARLANMEQKRKQQGQKQAQKASSMQKAQIVRLQKEKLMKEARSRMQAEKDKLHAQKDGYEAQLRDLDNQLHDRDMDDDKRNALERQKAAYQNRLQEADKDLVKADLEAQRLEYAHRESMAKLRQAAPAVVVAPVIYDDERGEEYDTDDPLVREALAQMQQNQDVEDENNGGEE